MSMSIQITFDCNDPHRLSRFWAEALGYEVEAVDALVREMLAAGYATDADVLELDGGLVWRDGAACHDPDGRLPRLFFQRVPEDKVVKNRVHLDLHVGSDAAPALVERLEGLGATRLSEGHHGPHAWVTMADPEGNELCVA